MRPRALVTGAAKRVGRAIALELAGSGFDVAIHFHRSKDDAARVADACRAAGAAAWIVGADLGSAEGCTALTDAVRDRWTSLHLLVNNASLFTPATFDKLDDADWDQMLAVNLTAPFRLSRDLLPQLRAADGAAIGAPDGQHGVVVHLCDIGSDRPLRHHAHYSASKAGLAMLVRAMAVDLAPVIRTVGVSPGQVAWPLNYSEEERTRQARRIPMGRVGTPEDVARLVRFLAVEGHYLNGVIVPVDGGLSCRY